jgi:hypothetical protein
MDKLPRFIPIWLWTTAVVVGMVILCSSCKGGKSLGGGSAGTVITPKTPQEINRENAPSLTLDPPKISSARSAPVPPKNESAKANPVIINPKSAGEVRSFTPTISRNAPPVSLPPVKLPPVKLPPVKLPPVKLPPVKLPPVKLPPVKLPPVKLPPVKTSPATDNERVIITSPAKNLPADNRATSPEIAGPCEAAPSENKFGWVELISNYFLFIILAIFIWTIYDILKIRRRVPDKVRKQNGVKKATKNPIKKAVKRKPVKKAVKRKPVKKGSSIKKN